MGRRKLILHIGAPKTGTTAIIDFLRKNTRPLGEAGFVFPQGRRVRFYGPPSDIGFATQEWRKVREALDRESHAVLVCDESLLFRLYHHPDRTREVKDFLGASEIEVVLYLRRQDLFYESLYREVVRGATCSTLPFDFDAMVREAGDNHYDYFKVVEFFEQEFGQGNVLVRPFWKERFVEGDLFRDFCATVNIDWNPGFWTPGKKTNLGADARLTGLLLRCNELKPGGPEQTRQLKEILEELGRTHFQEQENGLFSPDERAAFLARFEEGNRALAERFGGGGALFPSADLADAEVRRMTTEDLESLLILMNRAWLEGIGGLSAAVYNRKRMEALRIKRNSVSMPRSALIGLQLAGRSFLQLVYSLTGSAGAGATDADILQQVSRHLRLLREQGMSLSDRDDVW